MDAWGRYCTSPVKDGGRDPDRPKVKGSAQRENERTLPSKGQGSLTEPQVSFSLRSLCGGAQQQCPGDRLPTGQANRVPGHPETPTRRGVPRRPKNSPGTVCS